jgi:hypothetical protein
MLARRWECGPKPEESSLSATVTLSAQRSPVSRYDWGSPPKKGFLLARRKRRVGPVYRLAVPGATAPPVGANVGRVPQSVRRASMPPISSSVLSGRRATGDGRIQALDGATALEAILEAIRRLPIEKRCVWRVRPCTRCWRNCGHGQKWCAVCSSVKCSPLWAGGVVEGRGMNPARDDRMHHRHTWREFKGAGRIAVEAG